MNLIQWFLNYSDTLMPLLTFIISLFIIKKMDKKENILLIYVATSFVVFLITNIMADKGINNMFLYHLFSLFEITILGYYFLKSLLKKQLTLYWFILGGYFIFWIINIIAFENLKLFNSNSSVVSNLIVLLLAMYYLFEVSRSEDVLYFQKLPGFWIASAFLVSCALSILGFVAYKYFQVNNYKDYGNRIWLVPLFAIIFRFIFISIGLLCYRHRRSLSST
jgi:hypothetical protein